MMKTKIFTLFLLCLTSFAVHAIKVPGLYEIEVAVEDQSEVLRTEALETAFRLVLIKLTGDRQAPGRTALQPLMTQAQNYLQQYRYRAIPVTEILESGEIIEILETRLWVKFDEANLNQALRGLSVPVWGRERPSTLIWLALGDNEGRRLVGFEEAPELIEAIEDRASQRGISLLHPLLDLDDNAALRASDIWGGFRQTIFSASNRYHADAILTGTIESPVEGIWEAEWTAYIGNQMATWTSESDLLIAVLDEGVDNLADILASQFARTAVFAGVNEVRLSVADVFDTEQYAKVLKYLSSLNSVADVEVTEVEDAKITFLLQAHGGELAVTQAIELGRILEAIGTNDDGNYRLLP
jgi:uncharacterized protein